MLADAARLAPECGALLEQASEALGRDLLAKDNSPEPPSNRDVQVGVLLTSLMHMRALELAGVSASASMGLSLGEYAHLVHIGALDPLDAIKLVDARGALYEDGPRGKMVAVFPMPHDELADVLREVSGVVEIVNLNSPSQNVIAGDIDAVDEVVAILDRDHMVEAVVIEPRIPMHCSMFRGVGERLRPHLANTTWRPPRMSYRPNVDADVLASPASDDFVERLVRHVSEPVHWRASIERRVEEEPSTVFVEVGPGRVLTNLLSRRWLTNHKLHTDGADAASSIAAIAEELHDG